MSSEPESTIRDGLLGSRHLNGRAEILRLLVPVLLGITLVWLVLSHSLAAYFAEENPDIALSLNSGHPQALIALAEIRLKNKAADAPPPVASNPDPQAEELGRLAKFAMKPLDGETWPGLRTVADPTAFAEKAIAPQNERDLRAEIRILVEEALRNDPLNARALSILARISEGDGNQQAAAQFLEAAARRSLREPVARHFLMRRSFDAGDYAGAIDHADVMLRTSPRLSHLVVPWLARIAENPNGRPLLEQRLAENPPWRALVLSELSHAVSDARTLLELLLSLRETGAPPTSADLLGYINLLIDYHYFELAYYSWLQFLTPEQLASAGMLFNGYFEHAPSGLPFDWQIWSGTGTSVQITPAAGLERGRSLQIELGQGRIDFGHVRQLILLAPGSYRFTGRFKGELAGRRGLVWRIACIENESEVLAQAPIVTGPVPIWRSFSVDFTVPNDGCRAQLVQLTHDARSESERFLSGMLSIAEMKIARNSNGVSK